MPFGGSAAVAVAAPGTDVAAPGTDVVAPAAAVPKKEKTPYPTSSSHDQRVPTLQNSPALDMEVRLS